MIKLPNGAIIAIHAITSIDEVKTDYETGKSYFEIGCGGLVFVESDYDHEALKTLRKGIINRVMNAS